METNGTTASPMVVTTTTDCSTKIAEAAIAVVKVDVNPAVAKVDAKVDANRVVVREQVKVDAKAVVRVGAKPEIAKDKMVVPITINVSVQLSKKMNIEEADSATPHLNRRGPIRWHLQRTIKIKSSTKRATADFYDSDRTAGNLVSGFFCCCSAF